MDFTLTINGVEKRLRSGSLDIYRQMNGRATAGFAIMSKDQSYRPPLNATVSIDVEGATIFGGLITIPREKGLLGGVKPDIVTHVTAGDFNIYADRRFINETIPSGTLKAFLTVVVSYLSGYGVTLDPSQVDGPTLPELVYNYRRASDALNEAMSLTAQFGDQYVWEIDADKVLRAYQPSTVAAPFDLVADGNGAVRVVIGDIEVEQNLENYANSIIVKVAPVTEVGHIETFEGDGVTSTFTLTYTLTKPYGIIHVYELDGVTPAGGETFGIPPDAPLQWEYDPDTNQITRTIGPTDATKIYSLTFDGTFEATGLAQDAGGIATYGLIEKVILVEEVPEGTTAQSLAEGYLAQSLPIHHIIRYKTLHHGLAPGQTQTITVPARDLNGTAIITAVRMREFGPKRIEYSIDATLDDDTNILKSFQDIYKLWRGDLAGTGSAPTVGPGGPISGGPAPPFESVQFNREGRFGGNEHFRFKEGSTSVFIGEGHSVIAGSADNLLVGLDHTVE